MMTGERCDGRARSKGSNSSPVRSRPVSRTSFIYSGQTPNLTASPHVNNDLTQVSCTEAPDRLGSLAQRETLVDHRSDRSALDELCQ